MRERAERVDKKHRFPLRMDRDTHSDAATITFSYNLSMNLLLNQAIEYALASEDFRQRVHDEHGPRVNPKRGHFIYVRNWRP